MKNTAWLTTIFPVLVLLACASQGQAQPVYRCGQTYSQTPCPGAVSVDTNDARSKTQKQESQKATQRDKHLAQELEESRKKEDALALAGSTPAEGKDKQSKAAKSKKSKSGKASSDEAIEAKAKPRNKKNPEFFTAATPPTANKAKKKTAPAAP